MVDEESQLLTPFPKKPSFSLSLTRKRAELTSISQFSTVDLEKTGHRSLAGLRSLSCEHTCTTKEQHKFVTEILESTHSRILILLKLIVI